MKYRRIWKFRSGTHPVSHKQHAYMVVYDHAKQIIESEIIFGNGAVTGEFCHTSVPLHSTVVADSVMHRCWPWRASGTACPCATAGKRNTDKLRPGGPMAGRPLLARPCCPSNSCIILETAHPQQHSNPSTIHACCLNWQ